MAPYLLDELYEWLAYHCVNISDIFLSILTDSRFAYHSHKLLEDLLLSFPKILAAFLPQLLFVLLPEDHKWGYNNLNAVTLEQGGY